MVDVKTSGVALVVNCSASNTSIKTKLMSMSHAMLCHAMLCSSMPSQSFSTLVKYLAPLHYSISSLEIKPNHVCGANPKLGVAPSKTTKLLLKNTSP